MRNIRKSITDFFSQKKTRFILSVLGSIIYHIGGTCTMGISQYSVYITSFFYYQKQNIDMQYGNLIMPILMFSLSLFSPLGGVLENKLGYKISLIISSIITELVIFIFINQTNIWISFCLLILLGLGNSIGMSIPSKNVFYYYPKRRGIIGSIMGSISILVGTMISVFGEKIINPMKITLKHGEKYYPLEVCKNYILFFKYVLIIIPITLIISLLLIKKYEPAKDREELIPDKNRQGMYNIYNPNKKKGNSKDINYSKNLKSVIFNERIWRIAGISTMTTFTLGFSRLTFRVYGALLSINGTVMQYSQVFTGFSSIFVGPIWGYINDKFKYEKIIKIVCLSSVIHSLLLGIFIKSNIIYLACIFFGSIISSGLMTSTLPHIMKVYGMKYSLEIGGVIGFCGGVFNLIRAGISFIISKFYQTGEELQKSYRVIYLIGVGTCVIGFFLATRENEGKFIYPFSIDNNGFQTITSETTDDELEISGKDKIQEKKMELESKINEEDRME